MNTKAFGDFQTPMPLVQAVLSSPELVKTNRNRVLEPTCGRGNFIRGLIEAEKPPTEIIGVEVSEEYVEQSRLLVAPSGKSAVRILEANIFAIDFSKDLPWQVEGDLLVVGNPPWVTNASLGSLESDNLPAKTNLKGLNGIEAITGASNFDLAEYIWIKLIRELYQQKPVIALLCKTSVARNILQYARQYELSISDASIRLIDAKRWFNAAVDACLFTLSVNRSNPNYEADVYDSIDASQPQNRIGFVGHSLIPDVKKYAELRYIEGQSPYEWRQGIKHDAASVMELVDRGDGWYNSFDDLVEVEEEYVYPLIKSSDLRPARVKSIRRAVIVPQTRVGQNTWELQKKAPKLWRYLNQYAAIFEARKSSIYRAKPPFSIFGIGGYSFSPYKVCISGLYKSPYFKVLGLKNSKPFLCDDTCYLLPFDSAYQAAQVGAALNHPITISFLNSIAFWDAKRPITKSLLSRINVDVLIERLPESDIHHSTQNILDNLAQNGELDLVQSDTMGSSTQLRLF